jgi:chemotaxis signal transduction protein
MDMNLTPEISRLAADMERPSDDRRAPAHLLEYKRGRCVAFAAHATIELIECPPVVPVPGAPYYCRGLIAWQGRQLPLLDLYTLLSAYPDSLAPAHGHVLVMAYQRAPRQPLEYGALCAPSLVRLVEAADSHQCPLPNDSDLWPWIAMSCFRHEDQPVPVLDTARLFAQPHA